MSITSFITPESQFSITQELHNLHGLLFQFYLIKMKKLSIENLTLFFYCNSCAIQKKYLSLYQVKQLKLYIMGYTTDFIGSFKLSRSLTNQEREYLVNFSTYRRMKRDPKILMDLYEGKYGKLYAKDNTPEEVYGIDGEYFVGGFNNDKSIIDYNVPPLQYPGFKKYNKNLALISTLKCQPSLWCQWIPNNSGTIIEWDGGEKFYHYIDWIKYLIDRFFSKWGITVKGEVMWQGEEIGDVGKIIIKDNIVTTVSFDATIGDDIEECIPIENDNAKR